MESAIFHQIEPKHIFQRIFSKIYFPKYFHQMASSNVINAMCTFLKKSALACSTLLLIMTSFLIIEFRN